MTFDLRIIPEYRAMFINLFLLSVQMSQQSLYLSVCRALTLSEQVYTPTYTLYKGTHKYKESQNRLNRTLEHINNPVGMPRMGLK